MNCMNNIHSKMSSPHTNCSCLRTNGSPLSICSCLRRNWSICVFSVTFRNICVQAFEMILTADQSCVPGILNFFFFIRGAPPTAWKCTLTETSFVDQLDAFTDSNICGHTCAGLSIHFCVCVYVCMYCISALYDCSQTYFGLLVFVWVL